MNQSRDVIQERQRQLFEYIKRHHSIKVAEASRRFHVSELTIRRDLDILKKKELILRYHGGASLNHPVTEQDTVMEEKKSQNEELKDAIGKKAASFVPDGSTVFLNSGSTTLAAMKYLNHKSVCIVTNNALAPSAIWSNNVELIMTGGECRIRSKSLIGSYALNVVSSIYADVCILGVNAINSIHGTTTSFYQETSLNNAMMKRCKGPVIIVADGSKIGQYHNFISIPIHDVDILITDSSADPQELEKIAAKNVRIVQV